MCLCVFVLAKCKNGASAPKKNVFEDSEFAVFRTVSKSRGWFRRVFVIVKYRDAASVPKKSASEDSEFTVFRTARRAEDGFAGFLL